MLVPTHDRAGELDLPPPDAPAHLRSMLMGLLAESYTKHVVLDSPVARLAGRRPDRLDAVPAVDRLGTDR
jgi:hypothetical protein